MFQRITILILSYVAAASASITDCMPISERIFQFSDLYLKPDPPVAGQPVEMGVKFTNNGDELTDGTSSTRITLNFIPYPVQNQPLCETTVCPILSGYNDRSTTSTWPDSIRGMIDSKLQWYTSDGLQVLCLHITAKVGSNSLRGENTTEELAALYDLFKFNDPVAMEELEDGSFFWNEDWNKTNALTPEPF